MSRIVGDSLIGGPEAVFAPEFVTVRLTRGQVEAMLGSAEQVREVIVGSGEATQADVEFLSRAIAAIRAQIGGAP